MVKNFLVLQGPTPTTPGYLRWISALIVLSGIFVTGVKGLSLQFVDQVTTVPPKHHTRRTFHALLELTLTALV